VTNWNSKPNQRRKLAFPLNAPPWHNTHIQIDSELNHVPLDTRNVKQDHSKEKNQSLVMEASTSSNLMDDQ
jgi:hypothetical protein